MADLRVTVVVRDLPLAIFRDRLAEALNLTWETREGENGGPPNYRLFRSLKNRAKEQELAARGDRAFRKGIEDAIAWLSLSPEEQDRKLKDNPALAATIREPGGRNALELLAGLDPSDRDKLLDGGRTEFGPESVPNSMRDGAANLLQAINDRGTVLGRQPMPSDARLVLGKQDSGADSTLGVGFSNQTSSGGGTAIVPLRGASSRAVYPEFFGADRPDREYADARSAVRVPKALEGRVLDDLLERLADELKINIIAESFYETPRNPSADPAYVQLNTIPAGITTIENALDRMVPPRTAFWWKSGSVYMVQKRFWWEFRARQVPDSTISRLKDIFKQKKLTLDDWGEAGRLIRPEQAGIVESMKVAQILGMIEQKLPALSFYGNLQPMQRSSLFSAGGLSWNRLRKDDRARLVAWASDASAPGSDPNAVPWDRLRAYAFVKPDGSPLARTVFRAVLVADDGSERLLKESAVPGDPPARYRARAER